MMEAMSSKLDRWLSRLVTTGPLNRKNLHYMCALCGPICGLFFLCCFIAADFLPPMRPWWSAERSLKHYQDNQKGIHVGSALMMFSGMFFVPFYCVIADQMQRIPNIPWVLPQIQLAAGTASTIGFFLPGMQLAVAGFRKDRDPALVELANDSFWLFAVMPFTSFFPLLWSWSYAILLDDREDPLYPKFLAIVNFIIPCLFLFSAAVHVTTTGPFAWNGALGFWTALGAFGVEFALDTFYLPNPSTELIPEKCSVNHKAYPSTIALKTALDPKQVEKSFFRSQIGKHSIEGQWVSNRIITANPPARAWRWGLMVKDNDDDEQIWF